MRIRWVRVAALVLVIAAIGAGVGSLWPQSSTSPSPESWASAPTPLAGDRDDEGARGGNLDPALAAALHQAATDAAYDGIELSVVSGRRSPEHQQQLLDDAISTYGSEAEAARWVATPQTSPHVSGDAVDIERSGAAWLSENGAAYGLCRIYDNEPWHYELRPEAIDEGCPAAYPDPTFDPRMQQ